MRARAPHATSRAGHESDASGICHARLLPLHECRRHRRGGGRDRQPGCGTAVERTVDRGPERGHVAVRRLEVADLEHVDDRRRGSDDGGRLRYASDERELAAVVATPEVGDDVTVTQDLGCALDDEDELALPGTLTGDRA